MPKAKLQGLQCQVAFSMRIVQGPAANFRIFDKLGVSNRMEAVLYAMSRYEAQTYHYPVTGNNELAKTFVSDASQ